MSSHWELRLDRLLHLTLDFLRGRPLSIRHFCPEIEDSILWTAHSGISLTEAIILAGPPAVPLNEGETGMRTKDLIRLQNEEMINLFDDRGRSGLPYPFREVFLFSLAWRLLNISSTQGMGLRDLREFYLKLARESQLLFGQRAREFVSLFGLGMDNFVKTAEDLEKLLRLVVYPAAFSTMMMAYLDRSSIMSVPHLLPRILHSSEEYRAQLPQPKRDSLDLLRLAQRISESYRELRSSIISKMKRMVHAKPILNQKLSDVLDQLSRELSDWSMRRKFELRGAKVRGRLVSFYALYPSAPDIWIDSQMLKGMVRLSSESCESAVPWPFRERGIAYLTLNNERAS